MGLINLKKLLDYKVKVGTCILKDKKATTVDAGSTLAATWHIRDLNNIEGDTNFITLPTGFTDSQYDNNGGSPDTDKQHFTINSVGHYIIEGSAPGYINRHQMRLYDVSNTTDNTNWYGSAAFCTTGVGTHTFLKTVLDLEESTEFRIEHYFQTNTVTIGLGEASTSGGPEIYTTIKITRYLTIRQILGL